MTFIQNSNPEEMGSFILATKTSQVIPDFATNFTGAGNASEPLVSSRWGNAIKEVGQRFPTVFDLRVAIEKYALAHKFKYSFEKNNALYVRTKCGVDGCPWKLRASRVKNTLEFNIYKFDPQHVHVAADEFVSKFRASKKLVSNIMGERIRWTPSYAPKQIVKDFKNDFGVNLQYKQAWHGKELAIECLHGSTIDSYRRLPFLCQKIRENNPGSVAFVTVKEDQFYQCFIAFQGSLEGFFSGCRPIIFIDGTFLKAKFKGTLFAAQACDVDNGMYPIAFAIVAGETFNDWSWFLQNLNDALKSKYDIITSDMHPNIIHAVNDVVCNSLHAYCFRHLEQNVLDHVRGTYLSPVSKDSLKNALWKAACVRLPPDYVEAMKTIKNISPKAHKYLEDSHPEHWAVTKFPCRCWDQMTSNMAETFNNWILEAREFPIYALIDNIRIKLMTLISKHQTEQWKCAVGPHIDHEMKVRLERSSSLTFYQASASEYEVCGGEISHRVNLPERFCSCMDWWHSGLPCIHACVVMKTLEIDPYEYVDDCYKRGTQEQIYAHSILPIETWDRWSTMDEAPIDEVPMIQLPATRARPGCPKKKRIESQEVPKRVVHCRRCGQEATIEILVLELFDFIE